ncbi:MAG: hypothetical protein K6F05_06395 [Succinivibrio sp.]|nr:hypothetical protein [Succinivibrio sp.]
MLEINSGFNVQTQTEVRNQELHNQQVSEVGKLENDPLRKDNETQVAITGTEKSETDGTENLYSHQRHQALAALHDLAGKPQASEDTKPQDPSAQKSDSSAEEQNLSAAKKAEEEDTTKDTGEENDKKENGEVMTDEEQTKVDELKDRDKEVKTHEEAHMTAAGGLATGPYYDYEKGPDGKNYAVGGHVNIDTSEEDSPEKTIQKMEKVISSANAPAEPSSQDRKVAAQARQTIMEARQKMAEEKNSETEDKTGDTESGTVQGAASEDKSKQDDAPKVDKPDAGSNSASLSE